MPNKENEEILFSWLHFSDIHCLHRNSLYQTDQGMVLKALTREIEQTITNPEAEVPKPDAIFVTGDIAFSGAEQKSDEYSIAEKWLKDIAKATRLSPKDIFIIPGNHDVQRSVYLQEDDVSLLIDSLRDHKRTLEWALSTPKYTSRLTTRFQNYINFAYNFAPMCLPEQKQNHQLFWQHTIEMSTGFKLCLLGLNTVLLSQDDDIDKLQLSLIQLKNFEGSDFDSNQLSIVLSHHPLSLLQDGSDIEKWLRKKAHIHLCGHIHDSESLSYRDGGGSSLIRIQAGALYGQDTTKPTSNRFNYAAVILDHKGNTSVRIWNRIWSEKNKDFRDDVDCHPVNTRYAEHRILPKNTEPRSTSPSDKNISSFGNSPIVDIFVGRTAELSSLNRINSGVIAVTGIGGQGKSVFAAKFLENWIQENPGDFYDWRDCREESERFHTQLVSIIEHWTNGEILGNTLDSASVEDLVALFFKQVHGSKGLIILDNVDHYVDVSERKFILGMANFVESALQHGNNLTVLVTCRPRINYANPQFQEINLKGISLEDTKELFRLRGSKLEGLNSDAVLSEIHNLTDGHPLWLNLIATQIAHQPSRCQEIITELKNGKVDDRATTMMRTVWKGLNNRQTIVLRCMAELLGPEDIDMIHDCVRNEIKNWSKFWDVFRSLQSYCLIVETRGKGTLPEFDLHPIVRNFVRSEYPSRREREPIQDNIILAINTFFSKLGNVITVLTPVSHLEHLILKAELALRKDDYETAIKSLLGVGGVLVQRGIPGELFRVGELLLEQCSGKYEGLLDLKEFHELNQTIGHAYAEYGRKEDAKKHVERYSRFVPNNTAYFVSTCALHSYVDWLFGEYEEAIHWAKAGQVFKQESNIDISYDTSNTLALAQRDSGNVETALKTFLEGFSVNQIIQEKVEHTSISSDRFGNIGRCLQFQKLNDQALRCFVKSARLLENEESGLALLNRGYAAMWIGQVLEEKGDFETAYLFYRKAEMIWERRSPLRVEEPRSLVAEISHKIINSPVLKLSDIGIERSVKQWLQEFNDT